jgi:poly(3-hydroxybutyrate) depolymerase
MRCWRAEQGRAESDRGRPAPASSLLRGVAGVFAAVLLAAALFAGPASAAPPLPALGADGRAFTVSGLSSGAYMAVQMQVAHARRVAGAGVLAGGPYDCARGSTWRALNHCMSPSSWMPAPNAAQNAAAVDAKAAGGRIDPPEHLRDDRVWLFSGGADHTVERPVMDALAAFYRARLPAAAIRYLTPDGVGHALPSAVDTAANACPSSEPPYLNRCPDPDGPGGLDAPGELLAHLLPSPLAPPATTVPPAAAFDQRPFVAGKPIDASLAEQGYVYVPAACRAGGCRIHVAFHGCRQSAAQIGPRFVEAAGYNRWAESNRLIVLYPQTVPRSGFAAGSWTWLYNPKGCWDWWGYTGADYATQGGRQIAAVRAMVDRLAETPGR